MTKLVAVNSLESADIVRVSHAGETIDCVAAHDCALAVMSACDSLIAKHGMPSGIPQIAYFKRLAETVAPSAPLAVSDWHASVVDASATSRIEATHTALRASGVTVDTTEQLYATGTRLAASGYATQASRKREHDKLAPISEAIEALAATIRAENREDVNVSARELARSIAVNGKVTAMGGLALTEQAICGITARLKSPCLSYILGLRKRIAAEMEKDESARDLIAIRADKAKIAQILAYELEQSPDTALKLRTRKGLKDIFAVVSPGYAPADAPEVLSPIVRELPSDARGSWAYDPRSTAWELRASVWTPTPVEEQAVGEAFQGYASIGARDNGTSKLRSGGGIELLRCLNASVYVADANGAERVHRGRIMYDVASMIRGATHAIGALCQAWGINRATAIEVPKALSIEDAIPGFWRHLLTDRRSELQGVLSGRTETHITQLTAAFHAERRDTSKLVRADFAQGWTKYIQALPTDTRRDAETAIGDWLVSGRSIGYEARETNK